MTQPEITNQERNAVLAYLSQRMPGEWVPEETIENNFKPAEKGHVKTGPVIHYFHVRQILAQFKQEGFAENARLGNSFQITHAGKSFLAGGGYKD